MDEEFIRKRLTALRLKKGVSEYKISMDMGHSKGYIQSIASGRALPSLPEFLYMCEYLGVTPQGFFDEEAEEPILLQQLQSGTKRLDEKDLRLVLMLVERLNEC